MAAAGQLIALEGTQGPLLGEAARHLLRVYTDGKKAGGISSWDASNMFFEMRQNRAKTLHPSARTLILLYAYDLSFRLRWEIRPALEQGFAVVAAPYIASAIGFGEAAGLPRRWLEDLFSFAPKPEACYRLKERKKRLPKKTKPTEGFLEFCCAMLRRSYPELNTLKLRKQCVDYLSDLKGCKKAPKKS